jgi:SAM-dependent methyltransferase
MPTYEPPDSAFPSTFQFERTRSLRLAVYRMARLSLRERILDVGSGEGLVAAEMALRTGRTVWALDLAPARPGPAGVQTVAGDAHALPFHRESLDAVAFAFVLLWVKDPARALSEAWRVLKPGGAVLILSEPDLCSRADAPDTGLGRAIVRAVDRSGGHPDGGSRTEAWLGDAGFRTEVRCSTARWATMTNPAEAEHELAFLGERAGLSEGEIRNMARQERDAALAGRRRVLLPLYYGVGIKGTGS